MWISEHLSFSKINIDKKLWSFWYDYNSFWITHNDPIVWWPFCIIKNRAQVLSLMHANFFPAEWEAPRVYLDSISRKIAEKQVLQNSELLLYSKNKFEEMLERVLTVRPAFEICVSPESYKHACETLWIRQWEGILKSRKAYIGALVECHPDKIIWLAKNLVKWIHTWFNILTDYEKLDNMCLQSERIQDQHISNIAVIFSQRREAIQKAWEIIQAFRWFDWENFENIDLLFERISWISDFPDLNWILLENQAVIANWIYKDVWSWNLAWYSNSKIEKLNQLLEYFWQNVPTILSELIVLLKKEKLDKRKVIAIAQLLMDWNFKKPKVFNLIMSEIISEPLKYSCAIELNHFEPTLFFWKWGTWKYWIYNQYYNIALWKFFAHIYLNSWWDIPYKLWEKFIKKYIDWVTWKQIEKILNDMSLRLNPKTILNEYFIEFLKLKKDLEQQAQWPIYLDIYLSEWEDEKILHQYNEIKRKISNLNILSSVIDAIYSWIDIELIDDTSWDIYFKSRIWIELWSDWHIILYYPIQDESLSCVNTSVTFSKKDLPTMYLAMLESNCLETKTEHRMIW